MTAARVDWVMSPSPGDALVSCVKRAVPETKGNWHRQTSHSFRYRYYGLPRWLRDGVVTPGR
ncbi:hypothetical protein C2U50_27240 [Klebsiella pneumoniae]|nr:hypothetical protein C2U50_27240 [Klebsiella pneumoniae]AUY18027.1 hypothetical protein C3F39_04000 [Klebsiella pneumoniae]PLI97510.1 hypothetical protein B6J57_19930 [Klebsiella pneumoniae]